MAPSRDTPLRLPVAACWELEQGPVDSTGFFRALPASFPEATDAYFEGSAIAEGIAQIFERHANPGRYVPEPQTIWSTGSIRRFRCRFTPALCEALALASEHHAEMELFDHVFLYADNQVLLEWPDAFANCIWLALSVEEERVREFASACGLRYKYAAAG
jgi:hypothetical protein